MSMKFAKDTQSGKFTVPTAALKICGLQDEEKLEIHVQEKALVLLPRTMTAMELLRVVEQLNALGQELCEDLIKACGKCEECNEAVCPFAPEMNDFKVSPELLDAAGIPNDVRLWACPDEESKAIHIVQAPSVDLRDIQPDLLAKLTEDGICLGELQRRLVDKVAVYGG